MKPTEDELLVLIDLMMDAIARSSRHELVAVLRELRVALASARRTLLRSRRIPGRLDVKVEPAEHELAVGALAELVQLKRRSRHMHHLARDLDNPLLFETSTSLKE